MLEAFNGFFISPKGDIRTKQTPSMHRMEKIYKIIWKMGNFLSDAIPLAFLGDFLLELFSLLLFLEQGDELGSKAFDSTFLQFVQFKF